MTIPAASGTAKPSSQALTDSGTSGDAASVETDLAEIFRAPPIVPGESEATYRSLYQQVRHAVKPADLIEELWVRDITDLFWETLRLRRFKATLMTIAADQAVQGNESVLPHHYTYAYNWAKDKPATLEEVEEMLAAEGLDAETISAQTLLTRLDDFERIDDLIMKTEARRNAVLREIDRRRAATAERLRNAIEDITDVEIEEAPSVDTPESR
jgi:hypothetical protein